MWSGDRIDGKIGNLGITVVVDGARLQQLAEIDWVKVGPGRHSKQRRVRMKARQ